MLGAGDSRRDRSAAPAGLAAPAVGQTIGRLKRVKADVLAASWMAFRTPEAQRAMTRAVCSLGTALAVVAALSIHAMLLAAR